MMMMLTPLLLLFFSNNKVTCFTPLSSLSTSLSSSTLSSTSSSSTILQEQEQKEENHKEHVQVSFSHVHLYTDHLEDIHTYKKLEGQLNSFVHEYNKNNNSSSSSSSSSSSNNNMDMDIEYGTNIWSTIVMPNQQQHHQQEFIPQGRDIVKQLVSGLGFRITGINYDEEKETNHVVLTSKDSNGVQFVISALDDDKNDDHSERRDFSSSTTEYNHLDAKNIQQFYNCHANRQGIAVLSFSITTSNNNNNDDDDDDDNESSCIQDLYQRYLELHPKLIVQDYSDGPKSYYNEEDDDKGDENVICKVFEVYSYYKGDKGGDVDYGTRLRFIQHFVANKSDDDDDDDDGEYTVNSSLYHCLPGIQPIDATFDDTCMSAYCDHWVSNVISRTGFIETLEETLGFTPKVDFNAGVVAAGEAQIESTVTGNDSNSVFEQRSDALSDQSQVYLPINNALSEVGHVHGFIQEIGQGIQHIASRVDNLPAFVQRGNDFRQITGEGLTFLKIPRSYYGVLSAALLVKHVEGMSNECASEIIRTCEQNPEKLMNSEGAIDLDITEDEVFEALQSSISSEYNDEFELHKDSIVKAILASRYSNLYNILGDNLTTETYMAIVKNQILVDVQGNDLLFQIFTSNILQREPGQESPFLEFIQRVCSSSENTTGSASCPVEMKAGCGGFGIRNFLTLFLSIEVGKAMLDVSKAKQSGDSDALVLGQKKVSIFTDQLNEANPILTAISDAMTEEGNALADMEDAIRRGDNEAVEFHRKIMNAAALEKSVNNQKLMTCSTKYNELMKSLREVSIN